MVDELSEVSIQMWIAFFVTYGMGFFTAGAMGFLVSRSYIIWITVKIRHFKEAKRELLQEQYKSRVRK